MTLRTQPIRIAYCIDTFDVGGTELNAVRTAEALDPDRFELCVFHLQADGELRKRYEKLGVPMFHFPIPNLYSLKTIKQGMRFARTIREWEADVVHTHDIYSNIFYVPWARLSGSRSILTSRRWWKKAPRFGLDTLNRLSYWLSHRILANSPSVAELLIQEENVPNSKIAEIPNFLGENAFESIDESTRIAQRRSWGIPDGAFVIGAIARLAPVKNHPLILSALQQLDIRFHLVLVGDGSSRRELEQLAHQLGVDQRVHFAGEIVSPINMHQFFDVSVLCSYHEGFPNSIMEALAAARPVVATPVGGVPDVIIDGETGILSPLDNPARFAESLKLLEADSQLSNKIRKAGCEAVRNQFHQNIVIEKLSILYEMLARRGHDHVMEKN